MPSDFSYNLSNIEELKLYLRPPGQGIHSVSSGQSEIKNFTDSYLKNLQADLKNKDWGQYIEQEIKKHKVALLGIPSDNGAGIVRGASWGPLGIRAKMKTPPVFDLGDIFTVPHFLYDDMLSQKQISETRKVLYKDLLKKSQDSEKESLLDDLSLPVSPLSICKRVYDLLSKINPQLKILLLGGDHSVTWPAMDSLLVGDVSDLAIVHFDAHTDLLPSRLGVSYCFATWAYHANERIGRGKKLVQVGIRMSGKDKAHWEKTLDVKQYWAKEVLNTPPKELAQMVVNHLDSLKITRVYISNDIDGTDAKWAAACGTPEKGGLNPEQVIAVIEALKKYKVIGADLVEVAPNLSLNQELSKITLSTAVRYIESTLKVL